MIRWNDTSYQKIHDAKFVNGKLAVNFEDGDLIEIPIANLIPFGVTDIEWEKLNFNPFEITVPAKPNFLEIPWDKLRAITDREFGKHLAKQSEEQSKLIGAKVKKLREKQRISGKELAERAGLTPQTISRIELGHTDLSFVTLRKILASMGYSLKDLANQEAELATEGAPKGFDTLMKRMIVAGIDSNLVARRIVPKHLQAALRSRKGSEPQLLLDEAASYISTVYGWTQDEIWNSPKLTVKSDPAATAYFKLPSTTSEKQVRAYSHYAFYIAKIVLKAFPSSEQTSYPESIDEFKEGYFTKNKEIELKALLEFVWDLGICVLPLNDPGVFHGASWNIEGRHIIVLKQRTSSHARWIFDLLHELYHVFAHLDKPNTSVIEIEEPNPLSNNEAIEELEANSFANQFIFEGRAEELAEECVSAADWEIRNLSKAVAKIARRRKVREDFLANYLAFRLKFQGENWWSSAIKMQVSKPHPHLIATNLLKERILIQKLAPVDLNLLNAAMSNHEELSDG